MFFEINGKESIYAYLFKNLDVFSCGTISMSYTSVKCDPSQISITSSQALYYQVVFLILFLCFCFSTAVVVVVVILLGG